MAGTLPIGFIFLNYSDRIYSFAILISTIYTGTLAIKHRAQTAREG